MGANFIVIAYLHFPLVGYYGFIHCCRLRAGRRSCILLHSKADGMIISIRCPLFAADALAPGIWRGSKATKVEATTRSQGCFRCTGGIKGVVYAHLRHVGAAYNC
jgi:hypothetical protein